MFGRATITLGIGPHSSSLLFERFVSMACSAFLVLLSVRLIVDVIFAADQFRATSDVQMCNKIKVQNKTRN